MRENILKRRNIRGVLSVILTLVMILTFIPVTSQDVYADDTEISEEILEITDVIIPKVTGREISFEDYLEKRLLEELPEGTNLVSYDLSCDDNDSDYSYSYSTPVVYGNFGLSDAANFTEYQKAIYTYLKSEFEKIAGGKTTGSTIIKYEFENAPVYTEDDLRDSNNQTQTAWEIFSSENNLSKVITALLQDCPYELYWYDKTIGVSMTAAFESQAEGIKMSKITFNFSVNEYFRASGNQYQVNYSKINDVNTAIDNAKAIVEKYENKSDYEKLKGYLTEICALTEYNHAALADDYFKTNMNPWQMIYVFDNDPNTNVVCEGYSKAFQYLCDLTSFSSPVTSYIVTGDLVGGTGAGGHMWNVVSIGGKNYIVDVTNCDGNSVGSPDMLFLAGLEGNVIGGYNFTRDESNRVSFKYDQEIISLYGQDILTLASENYTPASHAHDYNKTGICKCGLTRVAYEKNDTDKIVTITGIKDATENIDGNLVIPDAITIKGVEYKVTKIAANAFEDCELSGSLTIGKNVTTIGDEAFKNSQFTGDLTIPEGVTTIGKEAFSGCKFNGDVYIPDSITEISDDALLDCYYIKDVSVPCSMADSVDDFGEPRGTTTTRKHDFEISDNVNDQEKSECSICHKKNIGYKSLEIEITSPVYTGKGLAPTVTITDGDTTLVQGQDYDVYTDLRTDCSATGYSLTITGKDDYAGTIERTWYIQKATPTVELLAITIPSDLDLVYNGNTSKVVNVQAKNDVNGLGDITVRYCRTDIEQESKPGDSPTEAGTYDVYVMITVGKNYNDIPSGNMLKVATFTITKADNITAPEAPTIDESNIFDTKVIITAPDEKAYEYSKDGSTWQSSNIFEGLAPNQTYSFYQRYAETNNYKASSSSAVTMVTTKKTLPTFTTVPSILGTYGTDLQGMNVSDLDGKSDNGVVGKWSITERNASSIYPIVGGTTAYEIKFTPSNEASYESITKTVIPTVAKKPIILKINDAEKTYHETNPVFSIDNTSIGKQLANADTYDSLGITIATSATEASDVGTYPITASYTNDNYDITFTNGSLTINKATSGIAFNGYAPSRSYNGSSLANPTGSELTITGASATDVDFVWYRGSVEESNKLTGAPKAVGDYYLVATVRESKNTSSSSATSEKITITKATPTISFVESSLSCQSNNIRPAQVVLSPIDGSAQVTIEYEVELTPAVESQAAIYGWTTEVPTEVGSYLVRAYLPAGSDNLDPVSEDAAVIGTYKISKYTPNPTPTPGGGGSYGGGGSFGGGGAAGIADDKLDDAKPEASKPTEVINPDGSKTETIKETKEDGTLVETEKTVATDGTVTEKTVETAVDGTVTEQEVETASDGSKTETLKETSADGKTTNEISVKTDANGKVTESTVTVESQTKGKTLTTDVEAIYAMIASNNGATKANTTVVLTANDTKGNEKYSVETNAKILKPGAKLEIYAIDTKGKPVIIDAAKNNINISKNGEIKLKISGEGDYKIVTPKEAAKIEKEIEKSVKPVKDKVTIKKENQATFKLDKGCNEDNIKKIVYKSDNPNVKVSKNGKITAKEAGKATINATVILANGKTKTIKMKVKVN